MGNKRLVIVIVVSMALVLIWSYVATQVRRAHPEWFPESKQDIASTQPAGGGVAATTAAVATTGPATRPGPSVSAGPFQVIGEQPPEKAYTIGSATYEQQGTQNIYPMALTATPHGAAVAAVTLNRFKQRVESNDPYVFQQPYSVGEPGSSHALATRQLVVNGVSQDISSADWVHGLDPKKPKASPGMVAYGLQVNQGSGQPLLMVEKEYNLQPYSSESEGYEVVVTYRFRNPTTQPVSVKTVFNGPNVPPIETRNDIPAVVVGYNDDLQVLLAHHPASGFSPEKPAMDLGNPKGLPLLWAGVTSAYFDAIVRPAVTPDGKTPTLAKVTAQAVAAADPKTGQPYIVLTFETAEVSVPAGGTVSVPFHVYFGPRQRAVLSSPYYASFPRSYDKTLVITSGVCAFCTFQWLINVLVWMLIGFHWLFGGFVGQGDWGLAIIALVLVVRLLLHPITKRSQISMSKMSKMGPEMERLKKKYGDNKEELNKAMMVFYKEQGITPILGCLPMFLQMPIWIALWSALQSTFELRHAPFLWGLTWIKDLAQPDWLVYFPEHPINLWFTSVDAINLLPILMGLVFWLQQKMTPKPAAMTPEQAQQQKMMQWMTLLFPLLLYSGPSGLNLYILTSTAIGIWESKRVRDHVQAQEEAERAGKVIIDAKATRGARRHAKEEHEGAVEKAGCWTGWLSNLQRKAEEVRQSADRRDREKK